MRDYKVTDITMNQFNDIINHILHENKHYSYGMFFPDDLILSMDDFYYFLSTDQKMKAFLMIWNYID